MPGSARETIRPSFPPVLGEAEPNPASRRWMRVVFYVLCGLITLFVAGAFFLPREVRVTRTAVIRAAPAAVYAELESLKRWEAWGPWFQREKFLEKEYSGPDAGPGALLAWKSKNEGEGKVKIVTAQAPHTVRAAVDFGEGGEAELSFDLNGTGDGTTEVQWTLTADFGQNMARRYFGLILTRLAGRDLDEGLANLKALLEKPAAAP